MSKHATPRLTVGLYAVDCPESPYLDTPMFSFFVDAPEVGSIDVTIMSDKVGTQAVHFLDDSSKGGDRDSTMWRYSNVHVLCLSDSEYKRIDFAIDKVKRALPSMKTPRIFLVLVDLPEAEYSHPDIIKTFSISSFDQIGSIVGSLFQLKEGPPQ